MISIEASRIFLFALPRGFSKEGKASCDNGAYPIEWAIVFESRRWSGRLPAL